jgi:coproporphyrinogen III oxidase
MIKDQFVAYIKELQNQICLALEQADGKEKFISDVWERPGGGGGDSRVIRNGAVIEKGGVNISVVHGELSKQAAMQLKVEGKSFFAAGLSLVIHPENPHVPTIHANWRYFELYDDHEKISDAWFGGGTDLTPYYLVESDVIHFHNIQKKCCDHYVPGYYNQFKKQCDEYFSNHHREGERRGVGGIFYDHLRADHTHTLDSWMTFVMANGKAFAESYIPIVMRHKKDFFTAEQKYWQEIRRGRYVEFNLIHDRGTLFGLRTNGRTESILMSLPATVRFEYDYRPVAGSPEDRLLQVLKNPLDWATN